MLSQAEVASDIYQVEESDTSRRSKTPKKLGLEDILKNRTTSPCSLTEFMDYLVCDEGNAEMLQFFTWFCNYVSRWSELPPQDMLLSPPWKPTPKDSRRGNAPPRVQSHRRRGSDRLEQILRILDHSSGTDNLSKITDQGHKRVDSGTMNFSAPRRAIEAHSSQGDIVWKPANDVLSSLAREECETRQAQQPHRDEITRIVRHYIRSDAPRQLRLSDEDLDSCLEAVLHTTHPSALLPAFTACETILKTCSHPSFIRKSQHNANKPRLILIRVVAALVILLGFALSLVLVASRASIYCRVASLFLWWPSFTLLIAALRGLCVCLYMRHLRQLRPWEEYEGMKSGDAANKNIDFSVFEVKTYISSNADEPRDKFTGRTASAALTATKDSSVMQPFGGPNKLECEPRWAAWSRKPVAGRIWTGRVRVQNTAVRLLQDRTMLLAMCWAGAVSSVLTVASLWLPAGNMF